MFPLQDTFRTAIQACARGARGSFSRTDGRVGVGAGFLALVYSLQLLCSFPFKEESSFPSWLRGGELPGHWSCNWVAWSRPRQSCSLILYQMGASLIGFSSLKAASLPQKIGIFYREVKMKSWSLCLLFSWLSIWFMSETIFIYRLRVRMGLKNISEFNFEDLPAFRQLCNPNSPSMGLGFILAFMLCQTQSASHKGLERRRQWQPTPVLLPGKSHGWRSLVGCSPWGCKESDMIELLRFHFSLSCIGEGNGNPLQRSCLKNPRDGGPWWGAQSQK